MGQWLSWIKSNDKVLLQLLDDLAKKASDASDVLVEMFTKFENISDKHDKIKKIERDADKLTRAVFAELNRTFITPLDREDIQRIASKTDDVIDFIEGVSGRIESYKVKKSPPYMLEISQELSKATTEMEYMVSKLGNIKSNKDLIEHCRNAQTRERWTRPQGAPVT